MPNQQPTTHPKKPQLRAYSLVPQQHPGQAHRIYIGSWFNHNVAIRVPNQEHASVEPFYDGIQRLFGLRLHHPYHYINIWRILNTHSILPVPRLLTLNPFSPADTWPTHAYIEATACTSFNELNTTGAQAYGRHLATLHSIHISGYGLIGNLRSTKDFHHRLVSTMTSLLHHYTYERATCLATQTAIQAASELAPPRTMAPIMLDLDPTQYFIRDHNLTHLVDLDFYAIAPPELELITLESIFPKHLAADFVRGYRHVRRLPRLQPFRQLYRTFGRLLCLQGDLSYATWHDADAIFEGL